MTDFTVVEMKIEQLDLRWEETPIVNTFKFLTHERAEAFINAFPLHSERIVRFNYLGSIQGHYRGGWEF